MVEKKVLIFMKNEKKGFVINSRNNFSFWKLKLLSFDQNATFGWNFMNWLYFYFCQGCFTKIACKWSKSGTFD